MSGWSGCCSDADGAKKRARRADHEWAPKACGLPKGLRPAALAGPAAAEQAGGRVVLRAGEWRCSACTFVNAQPLAPVCGICAIPRAHAAFFGAGWLAGHPVAEDDEQPPRGPAKRKLEAGADTDPAAAVPGEDSWRVCCLDGASFWVEVPEGAGVPGMKRAIGAVRDVPHDAMELFVEGQEEPLDDKKRLG